MKALQRSDMASAAKIRHFKMHRGRKSVTNQEWIHKGDDKNGTPRVLSASELAEEEWRRWAEGIKAPEMEVPGVNIYKRPESEGERMLMQDAGIYVKCSRGWKPSFSCGACNGPVYFKSC